MSPENDVSREDDADVMGGGDPSENDPEGLDHADSETPGVMDPDQFDPPPK